MLHTTSQRAWAIRSIVFGLIGLFQIVPGLTGSQILQWGDSSRGGGFPGPTNAPAGLTDAVAVAAGFYHSAALTADGRVVVWGDNSYGQTNVPLNLSNVVAIAAGAYHNLAVTFDGRVVAWGGTGAVNRGQSEIPVGLTNVVQVAAGENHSLALLGDGQIVAWGAFQNTSVSSIPVPAGLSNCITIASGSWHALGITAEGKMIAWGASGRTNVPPELSNVVGVAAGRDHTFALTSDGQLVGFGAGNASIASIPVHLTNALAVASERLWTVALASDGNLVAWGDTLLDYGQTNVPSPVMNVVMIAAGRYHGLALIDDELEGYAWRLPHPRRIGSQVIVEFPTRRGRLYIVEESGSLDSSPWNVHERFAGTGDIRRLNLPPRPAGFCRVRQVP